MRINIENGCTVIRKPFDSEFVKEQLSMGVPVLVEEFEGHGKGVKPLLHYKDEYFVGRNINAKSYRIAETLTILPALPKHPKPEDLEMIYAYMAAGLNVHFNRYDWGEEKVTHNHPARVILNMLEHGGNEICNATEARYIEGVTEAWRFEITHATLNGERVEVAIEDKS